MIKTKTEHDVTNSNTITTAKGKISYLPSININVSDINNKKEREKKNLYRNSYLLIVVEAAAAAAINVNDI